jgi:hypothetical protein
LGTKLELAYSKAAGKHAERIRKPALINLLP